MSFANSTSSTVDDRRRQIERRTLLSQIDTITSCVGLSNAAASEARHAEKALGDLERIHADFVSIHFRTIAAYILLLGTLAGVYWVDFLLFSSTAEYFAARVLHRWMWLVPLACLFSPALLLLIEIGISIRRDLAKEGDEFEAGRTPVGWTVAGVALAAVIPLLAVATMLAAQPAVSNEKLAMALQTQTIALAVLAFAGHLLVLFGGSHAHEAKAYLVFKLRQWTLRNKVRSAATRSEAEAQRATGAFNIYYHRLKAYNLRWPGAPMEIGPFDAATREFINERFGWEFLYLRLEKGEEEPSAARDEGTRQVQHFKRPPEAHSNGRAGDQHGGPSPRRLRRRRDWRRGMSHHSRGLTKGNQRREPSEH